MYNCNTMRKGVPCLFMKKDGCSFNNQQCSPIVEKCEGCEHIVVESINSDGQSIRLCETYKDPSSRWAYLKECPMATHIKKEEETGKGKKINPLKASKRGGWR